jgi:hypothetical protein
MKNQLQLLFLLILAFVIVQTSTAQNAGFFVGLNGSYNMTIVANQMNYGQKEMDYDGATLNPSFGLTIGYDINGKSQLSVGAGISNGGQKYNDTYGSDNLKKHIKLSYLSIPVLFTQVFSKTDKIEKGTKFFVRIGPQFSFLQSASVEHTVNDHDVTLEIFANYLAGGGNFLNFNADAIHKLVINGEPSEDKSLFNSLDIAGVLGLGIKTYFNSNFSLDIELRGGGSLTDINADAWHLDGFKDGKRSAYGPSRNVFGGLNIGLNYKF